MYQQYLSDDWSKDLISEIKNLVDNWVLEEDTLDVRLRVSEEGEEILLGDPQYDQDHRGHWGYSTICPEMTDEDINEVLTEMQDQVIESILF